MRRIPRKKKKRQSESHRRFNTLKPGQRFYRWGDPPCRITPPPFSPRCSGGRRGDPAVLGGFLAVGSPAGTNPAGSALPRAWAPRPRFYCLYLPFFFLPPPPRPQNLIALFSRKDPNCVKKKKDIKNPTRTPLFYCAFPHLKANPNPKLFILGGLLLFIA